MTKPLLTTFALLFSACTSQQPTSSPAPPPQIRRPLYTSAPDSSPSFTLDPAQPFHLEFGRGSGWHGLEMFILDQSGRATISRLNEPSLKIEYVETEISLPQTLINQIITAINTEKITSLDRSYSMAVADGTQWAFLLTQGSHKKIIYFDNNFPAPINNFATTLDQLLAPSLQSAQWSPLTNRDLEKPLWSAVDSNR
jgi:hypothetical protein